MSPSITGGHSTEQIQTLRCGAGRRTRSSILETRCAGRLPRPRVQQASVEYAQRGEPRTARAMQAGCTTLAGHASLHTTICACSLVWAVVHDGSLIRFAGLDSSTTRCLCCGPGMMAVVSPPVRTRHRERQSSDESVSTGGDRYTSICTVR